MCHWCMKQHVWSEDMCPSVQEQRFRERKAFAARVSGMDRVRSTRLRALDQFMVDNPAPKDPEGMEQPGGEVPFDAYCQDEWLFPGQGE